MDGPETIAELLIHQDGVISRRQLLDREAADSDIARMIRRRELVRVHTGVFVDHTGDLTWHQRAMAAVLYAAPAALSHRSALRAADGPGGLHDDHGPIHVVITPSRRLRPPSGVRVHRSVGFADRVQWNRTPPRIRYEEAALDVASGLDERACVGVLAKAVQSRRTTAARMADALSKREWIEQRTFLAGVLGDVAHGTCSVLEHGYLHLVELAHGLPSPERQLKADGRVGRIYRDASYAALEIELDGRLGHTSTTDRDRDFDRDLLTLVDGRPTARLSYGQVYDHACWTAEQVARLLTARGWTGTAHSCGPGCTLGIAA